MYQVFQYFILDLLRKDAKQPDNIIFYYIDMAFDLNFSLYDQD